MGDEDIALWADGTWCYKSEIEEYLGLMSDDYAMICFESSEWHMITESGEDDSEPAPSISGDCDICGEYSVKLVSGICEKPSCNRYKDSK